MEQSKNPRKISEVIIMCYYVIFMIAVGVINAYVLYCM